MWEVFTGGAMPYEKMKNVDVVDYVCQSKRRLEQPQNCPEKVYQVMLKCFQHVSNQIMTWGIKDRGRSMSLVTLSVSP